MLCLSFCLWAGSALLAQNTSISLRVKDKPLKEVLNQIETDEGYIFLYKDKTMDLERKISLDVRNASLETILRRILDEKTEFGISERQVVLYTRKEAAKTSPADTPSRKITVRGTVRDAGGNVLIGVSVVEKGTTNGTATDANGLYSIDVKSAEAILTFSYLSYKTVESAVSTRTQLDVTLEEDAARLDDVVIIGYGAQTKASITGALATVDTKELVKAPVASITNVLAGSVPGVATVQTSGQPGNDAATIYIRGVGSLNSNYAAPLVLVDGVEREFSQIDPNEIENFSILKDAASTAVFGVRGANGVILITTKRGQEGRPSISVSSITGVQQPLSYVQQTGSYEYARFWNIKQQNDGVTDKTQYFRLDGVLPAHGGEIQLGPPAFLVADGLLALQTGEHGDDRVFRPAGVLPQGGGQFRDGHGRGLPQAVHQLPFAVGEINFHSAPRLVYSCLPLTPPA